MFLNQCFIRKDKLGLFMPVLIFWAALFPPQFVYCQESSGEEPIKKVRSRLRLTVTQISGDSIQLDALLRAKFDKVYEKINGAEIEFYTSNEEDETIIGKIQTNDLGTAMVRLHPSKALKDENGYLGFFVRFEGNQKLKASDDDALILPAEITIEPITEDSTYSMAVQLSGLTPEGKDTQLVDADVVITVKRMVGQLKVGEGTTDEEGVAEIAFPNDLPGDDDGNLFITATVEDFEEYGNLQTTSIQSWGIPVSSKIEEMPRTLWSPYPPTWLLLTFLGLLAIIWGHYIQVILELRQVKKQGRQASIE